jgi:hypothetical protein
MSGIFTVFIFLAVIVLTAVLFCGWIVFLVGRSLFGAFVSLFAPARPRRTIGPLRPSTVQCPTRMCGAINPAEARFCRRCGRGLPAAQCVHVRRAAVW